MISNCRLLISYRLHSFLPALSFDTPAIKLSYDERALSLVSDIGYASWNIDIVKERNVIERVQERLTQLDELKQLKQKSSAKWASIRSNIVESFRKFDGLMNES